MDEEWSDDELRAAVHAYVEMQRNERTGTPFTKKSFYTRLSKQFGRSEKSFEFRMQNISYVLSVLGRDWITGLKPMRNVGAKNAAKIEAIFTELEGRKAVPVAAFEIDAHEAKKRRLARPTGTRKPSSTTAEITQHQRDPAVKAWVMQQATGNCECCNQPAPFNGADGSPFLEVHHVRHLADGGSDTVENAVALCPEGKLRVSARS